MSYETTERSLTIDKKPCNDTLCLLLGVRGRSLLPTLDLVLRIRELNVDIS